jgi:soluble lytic murein transglycosylase
MEGTGPEAARLAGLPWDRGRWQTDAAYNRALGRAYFGAQVDKFGGDVRQAWAAYNAGPRWVEQAVARARAATPGTPQADWFWQLNNDGRSARNRAETKDYVEKNWRQYGGGEAAAGQGVAPTSLREVIARAEAQLPPDASETLRQRTRQEATYQFNLRKEETDQEQAETFSMIYRKLAASGGDMSVLSPSELAAVPGDRLDSIISFADKLAKDNGADESDLGTYYRLSDPRTLRTMTDSAFVDALRDLNETDRRHFAAERAKLRGSTPARENDPNNLPSEIIGRTVTQFAQEIGLRTGGNGTDVQRIGTLRRAADQAVLARQAREGRRLSDAEVIETVSSVFNAPGAVRGLFGGTSRETERAAEVTYNRIPNDIRRSLTDSLKRRFGGRDPSETEVELEYLRRYSRAW